MIFYTSGFEKKMYKYFPKRYIMGRSIGRLAHLRNIRKKRYGTKTAIKRYVKNMWIPKAEKYFKEKNMNLEFKMRIDSKYIAILIKNRKDKNIFAFIDRKTGEIMRPKTNKLPHTRYQPKAIKNNINDKDGGFRYYRNVEFKYLP